MNTYHFTQTLDVPLEEAIDLLTSSLLDEGFDLLTEIDVQATIDITLGIEVAPYRILGFCNPHFVHQALLIDRRAGALLPCSVVVRAIDDAHTEVSTISPASIMSLVENDALTTLARDVSRCLKRGLGMAVSRSPLLA